MNKLNRARDEESSTQLRRLLTSFLWVPTDVAGDFEGAASIYRACRANGITPGISLLA
ncbi:hypothetical protein BMS3Bbin02_01390 [bacterium BMS3Bbin02]|nr:hypothetical protein BMS3Bbin02_01390 [bacterium BMS3Bbin02]